MATRNSEITLLETPDAPLPSIADNYMLVTNVPVYLGKDGCLYAEQLWFKDLVAHLSYLDNMTLACPTIDGVPLQGAVSLTSDLRFARMRLISLPAPRSLVEAVIALPLTAWRLFRGIRASQLIHTGIAGWPIPYGWIVTPIAKLLGKKVVIVVESAPWRLNSSSSQGLKSRITANVYEGLGRWCLNHADLPIFTQDEYRRSFLVRNPENGYVIHASWIDENVIISDAHAKMIWNEKNKSNPRRLAILFVGRLEHKKGLAVLLEAMKVLASSNILATLDILGSGELDAECRKISEELRGSTRVNVLGTVAYGPPLFKLIKGYDAVIVPSISDEQPRVVYDAYSQAVPVLVSDTAGLRDCVYEGETGWFVETNNVDALADLIKRAQGNFNELERMGMMALAIARSMTHQQMHLERHRLLLQCIRFRNLSA